VAQVAFGANSAMKVMGAGLHHGSSKINSTFASSLT